MTQELQIEKKTMSYEEEERLIKEVREGLIGRVVTVEKATGGKWEYTIAGVGQGFAVGFNFMSHRQHVRLQYEKNGNKEDFAEMYPEDAKELLDNGWVVLGDMWVLNLK